MNGDKMTDKITYEDVREYEGLFKLAPSFLLERFARKNSNLALKFKPQIESHINNLDEKQKNQLNIILHTPTEELQAIMAEAYRKTGLKQYKILADPKYRGFVESNIDEIKKLV